MIQFLFEPMSILPAANMHLLYTECVWHADQHLICNIAFSTLTSVFHHVYADQISK